jgi:signal transduction histidine kinase
VADAEVGSSPDAPGDAPGRRVRRSRWARLRSVRVRTTGLATLVVGVSLLAGGIALVVGLRVALTDGVERSIREQAEAAAEVLANGGTPGLLARDDEDTVAQVLDADGRVVVASPALEGEARREPLLADPAAGSQAKVKVPGREHRFLAVAMRADTPDGRRSIIVAGSLDEAAEAAETVTGLLALGLPVLLAVVAFTTWRVVGRALAPVEAIRTTVEGVSAADLRGRVPVAATGDEVARLGVTMNHMLDRLQQAQVRQRRFVSDASHELRSPVATIRQHAEVALEHPERVRSNALADTVRTEAMRLQRLVDDLLVLARADEHTVALHRRPLDLDDIVLDEVRRLQATTDLEIDATGVSAGAVDGDPDALRRVVRNVFDNAARHATRRLAVALTESTGTVQLVLEDDGPGVPPEDTRRVFERFVRLDDARARDHGGSGLGLAIVAELVAAHEGTVTIGDASLGGARVEVTLPART